MEEKLIEEVRKHRAIFQKNSLEYRSRKERIAAWKMVSTAIGCPVDSCRGRWKSLRDRFVKEYIKLHQPTDNVDEESGCDWEFYESMCFLSAFIKPRKNKVPAKNHSRSQISFADFAKSESCAPFAEPLEEIENVMNAWSDEDTQFMTKESISVLEENSCQSPQPQSSPQPPPQPQKKPEKQPHTQQQQQPMLLAASEHDGFFLMVHEYFARLPTYEVDDAKVFFINYLHEKLKSNRK